MTDQAKNYVLSRDFHAALTAIGARHIITRPYPRQTNGKVERFNRTLFRRVGLRPALPLERSQARHPFEMGRDLQSAQTPHRAGWQATGLAALDNVSGN